MNLKIINYFQFKKSKDMLLSAVKRRGQVLVLYALLLPLIFFCVGVGLDLGWYYLNVSRLQNAADAAVVAGAHAFVDEYNEKNKADKISVTYDYDGLIVDDYPRDKLPVNESDEENKDTNRDESKVKGDETAADYVLKNLSADDNSWSKPEYDDSYTIFDDWSRSDKSTITLVPSLYEDDDKNFY